MPEFTALDLKAFLELHRFSEDQFKATGLERSLLDEIHAQHTNVTAELQTTGAYISQRLQQLPAVHSLKVRIKDPLHLLAKIIRKKLERSELVFDCGSYRELVTDLIGIRALHLFKDEWKVIHDFVTQTWDMKDGEKPTAYYRDGDPQELIKSFQEAGCDVQKHPFGYRSVHYVIKSQPAKSTQYIELQVRTIFEEGWSEIDHRVRYPRHSDNSYLAGFLTIFNRLAGSADEMGTFTQLLSGYIREQTEAVENARREMHDKEEQLKETVSKLHISEEEKTALRKQIADLPKPSGATISIPYRTVPISFNAGSVTITSNTCKRCGKPFIPGLYHSSDEGEEFCGFCRVQITGSVTLQK